MRKTVGAGVEPQQMTGVGDWLDLEHLARVEVSSEDELFPIENALVSRLTTGWRASTTGSQVIRLLFDAPVAVRRIKFHIIERAAERSQEFALYAGPHLDAMREVVRQQFTFAPAGSTEEIEEYTVSLDAVGVLELRIDPDRVNGTAASVNYASLASLQLG